MITIASVILIVVAGIFALFSLLNWWAARTYKPTQTEVAEKLRRVLDGTMTWDEWDEFTCVPMRHNDDLDKFRRRCVEMETSEFCTREDAQEQAKWIYNQKGLDE